MLLMYGEHCLSRQAVHNWVQKFSEGRTRRRISSRSAGGDRQAGNVAARRRFHPSRQEGHHRLMEITLKNKCCLYVIIPIRFFSITICNLVIDFLSYLMLLQGNIFYVNVPQYYVIRILHVLLVLYGAEDNDDYPMQN
jgi:hypothetical protein